MCAVIMFILLVSPFRLWKLFMKHVCLFGNKILLYLQKSWAGLFDGSFVMWFNDFICSYICLCVCISVCVCVSVCRLYLARLMLHINRLGWWGFSNLSNSSSSWLHGTNGRCRLTVLRLQGLFQCDICVFVSVCLLFVETTLYTVYMCFFVKWC